MRETFIFAHKMRFRVYDTLSIVDLRDKKSSWRGLAIEITYSSRCESICSFSSVNVQRVVLPRSDGNERFPVYAPLFFFILIVSRPSYTRRFHLVDDRSRMIFLARETIEATGKPPCKIPDLVTGRVKIETPLSRVRTAFTFVTIINTISVNYDNRYYKLRVTR